MTVSVYVIYNKMNIKAIDMNINIIIFEIIFTVHTNIHGPLLYSLIWCQTVHMCVSPQSFLFGNGFKTKFAWNRFSQEWYIDTSSIIVDKTICIEQFGLGTICSLDFFPEFY